MGKIIWHQGFSITIQNARKLFESLVKNLWKISVSNNENFMESLIRNKWNNRSAKYTTLYGKLSDFILWYMH